MVNTEPSYQIHSFLSPYTRIPCFFSWKFPFFLFLDVIFCSRVFVCMLNVLVCLCYCFKLSPTFYIFAIIWCIYSDVLIFFYNFIPSVFISPFLWPMCPLFILILPGLSTRFRLDCLFGLVFTHYLLTWSVLPSSFFSSALFVHLLSF
jgi:hypothetical protein